MRKIRIRVRLVAKNSGSTQLKVDVQSDITKARTDTTFKKKIEEKSYSFKLTN